jgi:hypothetical protein
MSRLRTATELVSQAPQTPRSVVYTTQRQQTPWAQSSVRDLPSLHNHSAHAVCSRSPTELQVELPQLMRLRHRWSRKMQLDVIWTCVPAFGCYPQRYAGKVCRSVRVSARLWYSSRTDLWVRTEAIIPKSTFKDDSFNKNLSRVAFWTAFVSTQYAIAAIGTVL